MREDVPEEAVENVSIPEEQVEETQNAVQEDVPCDQQGLSVSGGGKMRQSN